MGGLNMHQSVCIKTRDNCFLYYSCQSCFLLLLMFIYSSCAHTIDHVPHCVGPILLIWLKLLQVLFCLFFIFLGGSGGDGGGIGAVCCTDCKVPSSNGDVGLYKYKLT